MHDEISWSEAESVKRDIEENGVVAFKVVSGSMEPVIMTGEMITVIPIQSVDELRTFDILLFWNGKLLICHYLWHINAMPGSDGARAVVTRPLAGKGYAEDLPTSMRHVLGKITSHKIPFWTKVKIILRKRAGDARQGILT